MNDQIQSIAIAPGATSDPCADVNDSMVSFEVQTEDTALEKNVQALIATGDINGATDAIARAVYANPLNATAYLCKAMLVACSRVKKLSEIFEPLNIALSIAPNYVDALLVRACAFEALNDLESAVKDYDAVVSLGGKKIHEAMNSSSTIKVTLADWTGLIANLNIRIKIDHNDAWAYFERAYCQNRLGRNDLAMDDLLTARSLFVAANDESGMHAVSDALSQIQEIV